MKKIKTLVVIASMVMLTFSCEKYKICSCEKSSTGETVENYLMAKFAMFNKRPDAKKCEELEDLLNQNLQNPDDKCDCEMK